jgi:RimJ/RimL family protein N-acetyltransferase
MTGATATRVQLRDGTSIAVRPIERDDKPLLREQFERMSPESRRRRYLTPATELTPEDLAYLTEVDHRRHEAVIALDEDGHCVGVARYVQVPGERDTAELAAEVVDDWQGHGVATALLGDLSERALENGIRQFRAYVSTDNRVVLDALGRVGAERTGGESGEIEFSVDVPRDGLGDRLGGALRAAATGQLRLAARAARRLGLLGRNS